MGSLLTMVDWGELERGVHGDPAEYVREHLGSLRGEDVAHGNLARLFHDHEPLAILEALSQAVQSMAVDAGKGEDYEVAVLVVKHLMETEKGQQWLAQAQMATRAVRENRPASDLEDGPVLI